MRGLLGDRVRGISATRRTLVVDNFRTPEEFREYFKNVYGPTIAVYSFNAEDADKVAGLDRDLDALAERFGVSEGPMEWEYLVVTAVRS